MDTKIKRLYPYGYVRKTVEKLHNEGLSVKEIADKTGFKCENVRTTLVKLGLRYRLINQPIFPDDQIKQQ